MGIFLVYQKKKKHRLLSLKIIAVSDQSFQSSYVRTRGKSIPKVTQNFGDRNAATMLPSFHDSCHFDRLLLLNLLTLLPLPTHSLADPSNIETCTIFTLGH